MNKVINLFLLSFATWLLVSGFTVEEVIAGALASLVISVILAKGFGLDLKIKPAGIFILLFVYLPVFVFELIKANFDVASRVVKKDIPLNPGFIRVETKLKNKFAQLMLANSITLTPGTMTVEMQGDSLCIHWIDVKGETSEERFINVAGKFESILRRVFND